MPPWPSASAARVDGETELLGTRVLVYAYAPVR